MLRHLPVRINDRGIRHQLLHMVCHFLDVLYPVVYIVNLSAARQLPVHCLADHLIVMLHDVGLDRYTVHWRLLQHTHIADADQAHVQRPWDRCCC